METKTFDNNEVVFKQGTYAETMYEVGTGAIGVFAAYGTPNEKLLATFGPSDFFGEMGLVECYPRSATAVSLAPNTTVTEITSDDFANFYQDQPQKVLAIMRQVSERLRETNRRYEEACHAVYDAIEAEKAGQRRPQSLRSRLSSMLKHLRQSNAGA
ncbi:MAG: cyclic nucleotide-binding domain-containing protein [Coriobacteriales bacterium]|nr:cyclic nucleotide-binding domain-containing protein [Coriobacteriales bacterium]